MAPCRSGPRLSNQHRSATSVLLGGHDCRGFAARTSVVIEATKDARTVTEARLTRTSKRHHITEELAVLGALAQIEERKSREALAARANPVRTFTEDETLVLFI